MANGIGRVWAANAGDDEQKPNGVGSVWIENIDALTPSGGASEQQINELSAAIDYVSANAGDPNALTGYQEPGVDISATSGSFVASGEGEYVITANPAIFEAKGPGYDLAVGYGGKLSANNSCSAVFTNGSNFINTNSNLISGNGYAGFVASGNYYDLFVGDAGHLSAKNNASAVFTNGSLVSADRNYGFLVSAGNNNFISAVPWGIETRNGSYDIKADNYGLEISANPYINNMPFKYRNYSKNISLADEYGFIFNSSASNNSAWIDYGGIFGVSAGGYSPFIASIGGWNPNSTPATTHSVNGIGFSGSNGNFGVFNNGNLQVFNAGNVSALNSCSATFTNASRTEVSNGHVLLVGAPNGIYVSGNGTEQLNIYNGGSVKASDAAELNLSGITNKIGISLNASGSRFISADGEGVSAWQPAPMTVMGVFNQTSSNAAFVIGNGSGTLPSARSDLFVIDYSGNAKSNDFVVAQPDIVNSGNGTVNFSLLVSNTYKADTIAATELGLENFNNAKIYADFSNITSLNIVAPAIYLSGTLNGNDTYGGWQFNNTASFTDAFMNGIYLTDVSSQSNVKKVGQDIPDTVLGIYFVAIADNSTITARTVPYTAATISPAEPKSFTGLYDAFGGLSGSLSGFVPISSYNEVTAKVNELEQVLQTYSGQWLIGG